MSGGGSVLRRRGGHRSQSASRSDLYEARPANARAHARTGHLLYSHGAKKNSTLFVDLLEVLRDSHRRARTIHLVLDNYNIHKSRQTRDALQAMDERIRLHFLPPYSPEHNPIERLRKQLHDNVTRNHRHPNMPSLWKDVTRFLHDEQPFPGSGVSLQKTAA